MVRLGGTSLVLTGVTVAAWVGWVEVAIVGVTLVGIAALLGWQVSRRRRAVTNPLRQLLSIGNQTSAGRISVIAG